MGCGAATEGKQGQPSQQALTLNRIYERLQLIGKGTFGRVYLCRNNLNGLLYALKVVDVSASTKQEAVRQVDSLKAEIRVLRKLTHPNIVKYYSFDISQDTSQVEIVLEYAQRGSLKSCLGEGPLSEPEAAARTAQILEGLNYLHRASIVHRDLKCANILVMEDGTLKITDFGTAKHIRTSSKEDVASQCPSLKGTPYYMAPEILRRTGHNTSADVWSLGCLVIEMLTGRAPWTSLTTDFEEIIGYILSGIHPPYPKHLSEDCEAFLAACLHNLPTHRATAAQLLTHPWLNSRTSTAGKENSAKYKPSLSKTNDEVEDIEDGTESRVGRRVLRDHKAQEIEAYCEQRTRDRQRKKQAQRESARPKKEKTPNLLFSEPHLVRPEEVDLLDYYQPVARELFPAEDPLLKSHQTAPQVKLPENLILREQEHASEQKERSLLGVEQLEGEEGAAEKMIDTAIARGERARYLEGQRMGQKQREQERRKWEQELKEGANYLRRELNSRYIP